MTATTPDTTRTTRQPARAVLIVCAPGLRDRAQNQPAVLLAAPPLHHGLDCLTDPSGEADAGSPHAARRRAAARTYGRSVVPMHRLDPTVLRLRPVVDAARPPARGRPPSQAGPPAMPRGGRGAGPTAFRGPPSWAPVEGLTRRVTEGSVDRSRHSRIFGLTCASSAKITTFAGWRKPSTSSTRATVPTRT